MTIMQMPLLFYVPYVPLCVPLCVTLIGSMLLGVSCYADSKELDSTSEIPALKESAILLRPERPDLSLGMTFDIGLSHVVNYTLVNQWDIEISIEEVKRQKGLLQQATGAFDYIVGADETLIWKQNVQIIGFKSDKKGFLDSTAVSLTHTERIGTQVAVNAMITQEHNPIYIYETPPYTRINNFIVSFGVTQPLLRNYLYNPAYGLERTKLLDVEAAKYDMIQTISTHIRDVVMAYWDLVTAKKVFEIELQKKVRLVDLAKKSLLLIQGGEMAATELDQQYAEIFREDRVLAQLEQAVYAALNQLLLLMGVEENCPPLDIPNLILEEYPQFSKSKCKLDICRIAELAVTKRPDVTAQNFRILGTEVQVKVAQNGTLPELDVRLGGNVHNFTLNRKAKPFFGAAKSKLPEIDISIDINFSMPLYNDAAIGNYRSSKAVNRQANLQQAELMESVRLNVATAIKNHSALIEQLEFAEQAVKWYEITLKDEQQKLLQGLSTIFIVVDFENRLSDAMVEKVQAHGEYAKNLVNLLYLTGLLVNYNDNLSRVYLSNMVSIDLLYE